MNSQYDWKNLPDNALAIHGEHQPSRPLKVYVDEWNKVPTDYHHQLKVALAKHDMDLKLYRFKPVEIRCCTYEIGGEFTITVVLEDEDGREITIKGDKVVKDRYVLNNNPAPEPIELHPEITARITTAPEGGYPYKVKATCNNTRVLVSYWCADRQQAHSASCTRLELVRWGLIADPYFESRKRELGDHCVAPKPISHINNVQGIGVSAPKLVVGYQCQYGEEFEK